MRLVRLMQLSSPRVFCSSSQSSTLISSFLLLRLGHRVQRASVLKPLDLRLVEGVVQLDLEGLAILGVDRHRKGLANGEFRAGKVNLDYALVNCSYHSI